MLKTGAVLITILFISCGSGQVWVKEGDGKLKGARIAVVGFDMRDVKTNNKVTHVSDEFSDALSLYFMQAGFSVIERSRISVILKEAAFQQTGAVDSEQAVKLGRIAGIRYVVFGTGTVKYAGSGRDLFLHRVTIKMIDVENGEHVLIANWSGAGVRPPGVARRIGEEIAKKFGVQK